MFINNLDPIAISFIIFDIRWYSLSYIFGILLGWLHLKLFIIKDNSLNRNFSELISYLIFGIIIGGRLGYVFFYNFNYYWSNPLEIFFIWQGGMSFHGGLIGVIIFCYLFSKKKHLNIFIFLDLVSLAAPIGIFLGRISNFINSELYGRVTELPWSVKFIKVDNNYRHPSQIYEAIFEGLILFIILNYFSKNLIKKPGLISALFLIFYSIFRFIIEFTREPDLQIGLLILNLSMGQIISIFSIIFGAILYYLINAKEKKL